MCLQTGRLLSKYVFILIKTELSIAFYIYLLRFLLLDSFKIKKNHDLEMHIKRAYPTTCMCAYMCWHMYIYILLENTQNSKNSDNRHRKMQFL